LFEAWAVSLGRLDTNAILKLEKRRHALLNAERNLYKEDYAFVQSVTQGIGDVKKVQKRFQAIEDLLNEVLKLQPDTVTHD
jgi:hypothetical protein